jgi:CHAD domain-containing protein
MAENIQGKRKSCSVSFRFKRHESIATGIRRVLCELLDHCAGLLVDDQGVAKDEAVHDTRRYLKRARAVLRLLRPHVSTEDFGPLDRTLRDCGRDIAGPRDAKVVRQTFGKLLQSSVPENKRDGIAREVLPRLGCEAAQADPVELKRLAKRLAKVRRTLANLEVAKSGWSCLGPGLESAYRKCQKAGALAGETRDPNDLHEWRKSSKHVWHQVQLLRQAWPELLDPLASEYSRLSTLLGDAHDLHVLQLRLEELPERVGKIAAPVAEAARQDRLRAESQAVALGARLLAEEPAAFEQRLHRIWKAWKTRY